MEIKYILDILWRRKWIIILSFLICVSTAILFSSFLPPIYKTSSVILVESSDALSNIMVDFGLSVPNKSENKLDVETHMEMIVADPILEQVIYDLQLRKKNSLMLPKQLIKNPLIVSSIFPKPYVYCDTLGRSEVLIKITAEGTDPQQAQMLANSVADTYIKSRLNSLKQEYRSAKTFVKTQLSLVKKEYLDVLAELRSFSDETGIVNLETETKNAISKIAALYQKKEETLTKISEAKAEHQLHLDRLKELDNDQITSSVLTENPQIMQLQKNLNDLLADLAASQVEKRPEHSDNIILQGRINSIRKNLQEQVKLYKSSSPDLQEVQTKLAGLEAQLVAINQDIEKHEKFNRLFSEYNFKNSQLELQYKVTRERYSDLLKISNEVGVAEAMTLSKIQLVSAAALPNLFEPSSPKKAVNVILGAILGLLCGISTALLVENLDDTIKTPDDVKKFGFVMLGLVAKCKRRDTPLILEKDPKSVQCESYRTIKNSLKFASLDRNIKSFSITSTNGSEGKTTIAINMGISIAREGKKVLIIDCDLRKPKLHAYLSLDNTRGLTTILAEQTNLDDTIHDDITEGLSIMTSGPLPPDPGKLIESHQAKQLIHSCMDRYDTLILDTPPLLAANDAIVLSKITDSCLFVVESNRTTRSSLIQVKDILERGEVQLMGAILNKFKANRSSYSSGYYYY